MRLELTVTGETCARRVQALTSAYVNLESMEHCLYNCLRELGEECSLYVPIKSTQMPIRQGHIAYEVQHGNGRHTSGPQ